MRRRENTEQRAARLLVAIGANIDALHAKTITHAEFHDRQVAAWDEARRHPRTEERMLAGLRVASGIERRS